MVAGPVNWDNSDALGTNLAIGKAAESKAEKGELLEPFLPLAPTHQLGSKIALGR